MNDEAYAPFGEGPAACPFVAFEDDRDRRADRPDYRHRCFASPKPEPRAFPHQERYCLAPGFTECPIFLDWAAREAASVVPSRRPSNAAVGSSGAVAATAATAAATRADEADGEPAGQEDANQLPAFLAGRSRPAPPEAVPVAGRAPTPEEGLWGPDAEQRGRGSQPVTGTARGNVTHPAWERPARYESYPRIKEPRQVGGSSLLLAALVVVVVVAAFLFASNFLNRSGGGAGPSSTPPVGASQSASASSATPRPSPTPASTTYVVKSNDTLTSIAAQYGLTIEELMAANPDIKNPDQISLGQTIVIPPRGASSSASASASGSP